MAITYQTDGAVSLPRLKKRVLSAWIKNVAQEYGKKVGEIAFVFCSDDKILEVNKQYLDHDYYTDIITFDYTEDSIISGDIFVSLDTVASNAQQLGVDVNDELHRIIIHGVLHLCGVNDKTDQERLDMTVCEDRALNQLPKD